MANMIKFYRGLVNSLPTTGVEGALYITTDEGAIYYGTGAGMKRLGDFIQVDAVANLPAEGANTSALYYCVAENILAKWNGTEWKQVNKQPTAEEMKTLLGLGSMAYKSEVAEGDLNADLKAKINASTAANHSHENKTVLDGITAEKVSAWDASEGNAKTYADGLNTAMNTRVEALEAIDHEHSNKALLDTYTQTEANLADAVAKKHAHTFNEAELNKIVEGDVAKWNGVAADHLTSADKTTLENAIKEAKKAGTDANTALESYKVTNDARVKAVEEDVAEIVDGTNGILAQAKSYSDGKLATARTEITAEIDADVKVVADDLAGYKTSNDAALAGVKATAEAAATKEYTDAELAKKVAKTDYEADKATFATKTELGNVDAKFANYKTAADQKAIDDAQDVEIGKKVDKVEGKDLIATSEIERLATLKNYDDTALAGRMTTAEGKITALETESAKHALKTEVEAEFAKYTKTADLPTDLGDFTNNAGYAKTADVNTELDKKADKTQVATDIANAIAPLATTEALNGVDAKFANYTNTTDMNAKFDLKADKSVVDAMYTNTQIDGFITTEKSRAEGIEAGLRTDVDAIKADYLKASDKTELEGKITAEETRAKGVEESLQTQINTIMSNPDAEGAINSINEFTQYVTEHGTIADGFRADIDKNKEDIAANAKAIADETTRATGSEEALGGRIDTLEADYSAHTHSWNDLEDKPFGGTNIALECDPAAAVASGADRFDSFVKVSDTILTKEDLVNAQVMRILYGNENDIRVSDYEVVTNDGLLMVVAGGYGSGAADNLIAVVPDETVAERLNVTPGTYVLYIDDETYVSRIENSAIKTIDEAYLPSTIARTADVEDLDTRVEALEAIDHEAYVAADAATLEAAKTDASNKAAVVLAEAQAYADQAEADAIAAAKTETENQVKALADGQVTTNKNDIASIMEMLTWGSFGEEVDE